MANKQILWGVAVFAALTISTALDAQTIPLAYTPIDAQYSEALERIIMVSGSPDQLHIYDPVSQTDVVVGLPKTPNAVSVSPDGLYAAVGHDALISYVNLSTASIQRTFTITDNAQVVILSGTWIHVLSTIGGFNQYNQSIEIGSGAVTNSLGVSNTAVGRLNPAGNAIYSIGSTYGPLTDYNVGTGPITSDIIGPYSPQYPECGPLWLSPDGSRIYTGCGLVFQATTNSLADMHYMTSLTGMSSVSALTSSTPLSMVALVQNIRTYPYNDDVVMLLDSSYLQPLGQFVLPGFTYAGNSVSSHGRWVFFNRAGTDLFVLMQGRTSSGSASGFAIQVFPMGPPVACGATFTSATATAIAAGALDVIGITAADTCVYRVSSNASWLEAVSGGYGSGNGNLTYLARPNAGTSARTAILSIGGQTLTVTQSGAPAATGFQQLAYNITDAAYDTALDKIVFVASGPNELHVYDPVTQADTVVPLPLVPLSLSVRPDGAFAAVGHTGWVSYVNLQTATVVNVFEVNTDAANVVLAGNGYLYVFPMVDQNVYSLKIATGTATSQPSYQPGPVRLHPDDQSIYQYSGRIDKWSIATGTPTNVIPMNSAGACGNLWINADGLSIVTECGTVYSASEVDGQDLLYLGTLLKSGQVIWATESVTQQSLAVIPQFSFSLGVSDTEVQIYGNAYWGYAGSVALPLFMVGSTPYTGHGKFAFWNAAGTSLYVIEQADVSAHLLSSFGVDSISPSSSSSGCTFGLGSTSVKENSGLGFDFVAVTTGASCVWTAQSNASWLTINAGAMGFGSANLQYSFSENVGATRSGTITIAGQTFTVTQTGLNCSYAISPTQQTFGSGGGSGSTNVSAAAGCPWTAVSAAKWITVTAAGTGDGNGTVSYAVAPNASGKSQTGTIAIGGQTLTVTEAAPATGDFNRDGHPDLVWENNSTAQVTVNYFGGTGGAVYQGWSWLNNAGAQGWKVVGTGDFDHNGVPDLVWMNTSTRQVSVNYYGGPGGATYQGWAWLNQAGIPGWTVVAVADMNGDGVPDLIWQNDTTNQVTVNYYGGAGGAVYQGWNWLNGTGEPAGWRVVGAADFDQNGTPDLVWQYTPTRQVSVNYYGGAGGATYQGWKWLNSVGNAGWSVVGANDFDGNGVPDLVWQNDATGQVTVNYYSGAGGASLSGWNWLNSGGNPGWKAVVPK